MVPSITNVTLDHYHLSEDKCCFLTCSKAYGIWQKQYNFMLIVVGLPFREMLNGNGVINSSWKQHIKRFLNALDLA